MGLVGMKPGLRKLKASAGIANTTIHKKESAHVACSTNPISQPNSKFSPTWVPLISNEIRNLYGRLHVSLGEMHGFEFKKIFSVILYSRGIALQHEENKFLSFVYLRVTMVTKSIMA
jgi:hypothetical protein